MDIAIGLNATIPGVTRDQLLEWARRADARGFSSLGTIDRLVYPNWEPLIALAAAAAVTERIRLTTAILLAPFRSTAVMAKQLSTLHALSNGRAVIGIAIGGREDDFTAAGADFHTRGKRFDAQLAELKEIWSGAEKGFAGGIGPAGGPPLVIGGGADPAIRRAVEHGVGWIAGGAGPEHFAATAAKVKEAWSEAGREGEPALKGLAYFSLGPDARANADGYLKDYYGFLGEYADRIAQSAAVDEGMVRQYIEAYEAAGCDELILFPCSPDPEQVDLLASVAL